MDRELTHLSLFSGIGGLDLAAEWAGFTTVAFVERDKYCRRVLAKHWPGVPIFDDVADVSNSSLAGLIRAAQSKDDGKDSGRGWGYDPADIRQGLQLLTGGFPCQPHSVAGKRKASGDERDLWHECARITGELRPRWAVFENVPGLLSSERGSFFGRILGDLAALGYSVGWGVWGASDVGALHQRQRAFIVARDANADDKDESRRAVNDVARIGLSEFSRSNDVAHADEQGSQGRGRTELRERAGEWSAGESSAWRSDRDGACWESEPEVGRVAHGVPRRVDRLRALGNAVVPQQAYPLLKAIADHLTTPGTLPDNGIAVGSSV